VPGLEPRYCQYATEFLVNRICYHQPDVFFELKMHQNPFSQERRGMEFRSGGAGTRHSFKEIDASLCSNYTYAYPPKLQQEKYVIKHIEHFIGHYSFNFWASRGQGVALVPERTWFACFAQFYGDFSFKSSFSVFVSILFYSRVTQTRICLIEIDQLHYINFI